MIEVRLTREEAETVKHALLEELRRVKEGGGNQYGHLSSKEAEELVQKFE